MVERPIIFSRAMVRAILQGKKQQTRRIVKEFPTPSTTTGGAVQPLSDGRWEHCWDGGFDHQVSTARAAYGVPGDRLWVRETFANLDEGAGRKAIHYRADKFSTDLLIDRDAGERWTPSIHMPRAACRLQLDVVAVRIERLQDISEDDAKAEGVEKNCDGLTAHPECPACKTAGKCQAEGEYIDYGEGEDGFPAQSAKDSYRSLWDSLNAKRYPWVVHPWVWVIEFRPTPGCPRSS